MSLLFRFWKPVCFCLLVFLTVGCSEKTIDGRTITISFAWWMPLLTAVLSLVSLGVAIAFRKNSWRYPVIFGAAGVFGLVGFLPNTFLDRTVLDDEHFEGDRGLSVYRVHEEFKFDDVTAVTVVAEESRGRRNRVKIDYSLIATPKAGKGEMVKMPLGDFKRLILPDLRERVEAKGVPFVDRSDTPIKLAQ